MVFEIVEFISDKIKCLKGQFLKILFKKIRSAIYCISKIVQTSVPNVVGEAKVIKEIEPAAIFQSSF